MMRPLEFPAAAAALASALLFGLSPGCTEARPGAAGGTGHLAPCGRALCEPDGGRFAWRGVTAFGLADLVADGRDEDARAFVSWAARTGFTVLRVLAMNHGWIDLAPEAGRRALPTVFALAREEGLHVQVVALAGTKTERYSSEAFLREQVGAVSRLCAAAPNCVLEIANEPYHSSQAGLDDPALMSRLQQAAAAVPVTWGAPRHDAPDRLAGGTFVVVHLPRGGERWRRLARMQDLHALSVSTGKFVVDNEPIGAAEEAVRDRRDSAPQAFYAQGVLSRIFDVGSTLHCEDCLHAKVPGPRQQDAARAFVAGATVVPDDVALTYTERGSVEGPLASGGTEPARDGPMTFAGVANDAAWIVALGDASGPPDLRPGWRIVEQVSPWPEVRVWKASRSEKTGGQAFADRPGFRR